MRYHDVDISAQFLENGMYAKGLQHFFGTAKRKLMWLVISRINFKFNVLLRSTRVDRSSTMVTLV